MGAPGRGHHYRPGTEIIVSVPFKLKELKEANCNF
ncbi:uncharacterized protein G2W53_024410 [Senna tora]|uniref:Uncharacterized protein n=1 Tax=Senna tora TaxID=362788 RepID=A0A834TC08_9FABA|nr:uncharacterized protein G2W53_024410 [Senna tora]